MHTGSAKEVRGLIFNVQQFSVHDGPGIRDVVFLKGCPLRCHWCSNPESQNPYPEIAFVASRCIGVSECGRCFHACATGAIRKSREGMIRIDRKCCNSCGSCVDVCPTGALKVYGTFVSVNDVVKVIEEDGPFYMRSGGGITVSGGEPMCQVDFVEKLLAECLRRGIDTAIETSGYGLWEDLERICRHANSILYDFKCLNTKKHKSATGVPNRQILANLNRLIISFPGASIVVRTPVIPGFNDTIDDIGDVVRFFKGTARVKKYELLAYHGFGEPKYLQIGRKCRLTGVKSPSEERMIALRRIAGQLNSGRQSQ